jgi:hypothetical protein
MSTPHAADTHDLIRVHGARVNNLKDVSVEIPKRRLTVFTGVSGSGKSSLVFGTIAAESQRLINETYSAFLQGFMPTLARPDVDVLDGLTTAILVDQERMGGDVRSTVGTATDANAMLRILFSRLGQPHIGPPQAFSFNVASISGAGAVTIERAGHTTKERRSFSILGGMCPRCEGRGSVNDFDLTQLYDDSKSLNEGALTIPGYSMDGWYAATGGELGYADAVNLLAADAQDYWARTFPSLAGRQWQRLRVVAFDTGSPPDCPRPDQTARGSAFYCPDGDFVAFDNERLAPTLYQRIGDNAVGMLLGDLFARAAQDRRGAATSDLLTVDCLAGSWTNDLLVRGAQPGQGGIRLSPGDLDEAVAALLAFGRAAEGSEPTAFDRIAAYRKGVLSGLRACT